MRSLIIPLSYVKLLFHFKPVFKQKRTFSYFCIFMTAFALFKNSTIITQVVRLFNLVYSYTNFYRFFSQYKWSIEELSVKFLELAIKIFSIKEILFAGDDTIVPKYGKKIFGCSIHFDHAKKHNFANYIFGLNWVTLGLVINIKGFNKDICLPFMAKLFISKNGKTRIQIMMEMLSIIVDRISPQIPITLVVDGLYAKKNLVKFCKNNQIVMVSRFRNDANLYESYKQSNTVHRGRPGKYGKKINLRSMAKKLITASIIELSLYRRKQQVQYISFNAVWKRSGDLVKVLLVKYNSQKDYNVYFSTNLNVSDIKVLELIAMRWTIETTFSELKEHFGLEKWQIRNEKSVNRSATVTCMSMSLLLIWSIQQNPVGKQMAIWDALPWYKNKFVVSIIDVKEQFRRHCIRLYILRQLRISPNSLQKSEVLSQILRFAA